MGLDETRLMWFLDSGISDGEHLTQNVDYVLLCKNRVLSRCWKFLKYSSKQTENVKRVVYRIPALCLVRSLDLVLCHSVNSLLVCFQTV